MVKPTLAQNIMIEKEFAALAQVLTITADNAARCLKILKMNLAEYDSRQDNHLLHTAKLYLRTDIRNAKDTSADLKSVAHRILTSRNLSKSEVQSARKMMMLTSKAMDLLIVSARNYDVKYGRTTGVKGAIKKVLYGKDEVEKDESRGLFAKSDNQSEHYGGAGILEYPDTAEMLVKLTLRDNFSLDALNFQIDTVEKSLSYSVLGRAKEALHDAKDALKGNPSPIYVSHDTDQFIV